MILYLMILLNLFIKNGNFLNKFLLYIKMKI